MTSNGQSKSEVQSIDRAVWILNAFTAEQSAIGVSELARVTGLSRSTTHRLLASLQAHGLVRQVGSDNKYALGPHILRLASVADHSMDLRSLAWDLLDQLRDECTETVGLHVFEPPRYRVTIAQSQSWRPLRRIYTEFGPLPVHQGAPGKVLLAHLPRQTSETVLTGHLEAATERTITNIDKLRGELDNIVKQGFALSIEERVHAVSALAVPVFDHHGIIAAALSVTGPTSRLSKHRLIEIVPQARRIAGQMSVRLGNAMDPQAYDTQTE